LFELRRLVSEPFCNLHTHDCDIHGIVDEIVSSIVLQDPYLFSGTIADNIRLGTDGITDQALALAVEKVISSPASTLSRSSEKCVLA
jgi:ABC-type transport system involved in cytochrome bd biosynthesis fused ATPase/permease subunit